jgi:hypothetical protein
MLTFGDPMLYETACVLPVYRDGILWVYAAVELSDRVLFHVTPPPHDPEDRPLGFDQRMVWKPGDPDRRKP